MREPIPTLRVQNRKQSRMWNRFGITFAAVLLSLALGAQVSDSEQRTRAAAQPESLGVSPQAARAAQADDKGFAADELATVAPSVLLHSYRLERTARYKDDGKILSSKDLKALEDQLNAMEVSAGNSAAFALARWEHFGYLKEDYQAFNDRISAGNHAGVSPLDEAVVYATYGILHNQPASRKKGMESLVMLHNFTPAATSFHRNLLTSAQPNAILFTHGFNDTFGVLAHQLRGVRTDVTVVQLDWLRNDAFRKRIYAELGIPENQWNDTPSSRLQTLTRGYAPQKPLYLSTTLPPAALRKLDLWPEGLLLRALKPVSYDNTLSTASWWETQAVRTQLRNGESINRNYLIALSLLNNYYQKLGKEEEAAEVQSLLNALTPKPEQKTRVKQVTTY